MSIWQSIPYTLAGPNDTTETVAVVNDPDDARFIGWLSEPPQGLGVAGVRERGGTLVDGDGGWHGPFLQDRMPFSLAGIIPPSGFPAIDEGRASRLKLATHALRSDGVIYWTETERGALCASYRTQQRTRVTGRRPKTFTCTLVSADYRVFSQDIHYVTIAELADDLSSGESADFEIPNLGNAPVDWDLRLTIIDDAHLTGLTVQFYADTGRTKLIGQTEVSAAAGYLSSGDGNTVYVRGGNPSAPFPGDTGALRNIAGDDLVYFTDAVEFHPLNWAPAGVPEVGGTVYGRLTIRAGSTGIYTAAVSYRDAWDY